jgi:MSHA type pilus biogenesis protein MshL
MKRFSGTMLSFPNITHFAAVMLFAMCLSACQDTGFERFTKGDPIDRELGLKREDYRDLYDQKTKPIAADSTHLSGASKVPEMASVLAAPRPPKVGETKLVSIAVTDDVPLKDVLIELSKLADVDLEMDANIEGGVTFRAKDRPFSEVIERISDLAGLRYKYAGGVLRVERDLPYIQNYPIDFLNIVRSSVSNNSITTDVLSISSSAAGGQGGGGSTGINTGSTTTIDTEATDDFWESLDANVRAILTYSAPRHLSGVPIQALPAQTATPAAGTLAENLFYVINRQAGVLSVAATEAQHEDLEKYLTFLKRNATAQVLIEAKVVEVDLNEQFQSGIDWNLLQKNIGQNDWQINTGFGPEIDSANLIRFALTPTDPEANIDAVLTLTEKFGTTRTLSSPRLHAINNQPAVLTFAENRVFFEVQLDQQPDTVDSTGQVRQGQLSVQTERRSIPIGIILNILPSVNLESNEVTLGVRPTLTRQVGSVVDPGAAFASQILISNPAERFVNTVPIVEVRELDSIMRLRSGQVMVIGGLMEQFSVNQDSGVPFLSGVPFVGNLFKGVDKQDTNRELIIFVRATIVSPEGSYGEADQRVYQKFTKDPRPIAF